MIYPVGDTLVSILQALFSLPETVFTPQFATLVVTFLSVGVIFKLVKSFVGVK